jgi:hypothetical protein
LNDPANPDYFRNFFAGREALRWFTQADLRDIRVVGADVEPHYAGSRTFEMWYGLLQNGILGGEKFGRQLLAIGAVDAETMQAAKADVERWHSDPHAFFMTAGVCAAGRV